MATIFGLSSVTQFGAQVTPPGYNAALYHRNHELLF